MEELGGGAEQEKIRSKKTEVYQRKHQTLQPRLSPRLEWPQQPWVAVHLLLCCLKHLKLSVLPAFPDRRPPALACPTSCGLHCNFGFLFIALYNSLSSHSCRDLDPTTQCLALVASGILMLDSMISSLFRLLCQQSQYHVANAAKLC